MEKEIKIEIPEGYEIDKEKSTFEKIVFKKKEIVNTWDDLPNIEGVFITGSSASIKTPLLEIKSTNKNIFLNEKYAKSALALAQISQLLPYYDSKVDWSDEDTKKYCIISFRNKLDFTISAKTFHLLAFNTLNEAKRFLKYNEQLVKDYFMLD